MQLGTQSESTAAEESALYLGAGASRFAALVCPELKVEAKTDELCKSIKKVFDSLGAGRGNGAGRAPGDTVFAGDAGRQGLNGGGKDPENSPSQLGR